MKGPLKSARRIHKKGLLKSLTRSIGISLISQQHRENHSGIKRGSWPDGAEETTMSCGGNDAKVGEKTASKSPGAGTA